MATANQAWPLYSQQRDADAIRQKADPDANAWKLLLGAALYREEKFDQAIKELDALQDQFDGDNGFRLFTLAMAELESGNQEQAKQRYDQALRWIAERPNVGFQIKQLRQEADKLFAENGIKPAEAAKEDAGDSGLQ